MKAILSIVIYLLLGISTSWSQFYNYEIDLSQVEKDQLHVELKLEGFNNSTLTYHFPKIIPGTYAIQDFGKYVSAFKAYDKENSQLRVKKKGKNSYQIKDASKIAKVTYTLDDTWDSHVRTNKVFTPAGTSFHKGIHFFLNTPGVFGYFEGATNNPFEVRFKNPGELYGSSALFSEFDGRTQVFRADSYYELSDSPILFAPADTISFRIKNCKVTLAARHSSGKKIAKEMLPLFQKSMKAISGFFEELPSDKYTFLIYIKDAKNEIADIMENPGILPIAKIALKYPGIGALEHNKSSTYFLLDLGDLPKSSLLNTYQYDKLLESIVIHEFMHTLTPLQLRTEYIDNFDYQNPRMSQHLWLYEGVTDYFADIIRVKAGQLEPNAYLNTVVKEKWEKGKGYPYEQMSFTEMSSNVLKGKYHKEYNQVYQYGPMLALCLDLEIMKLTNGEKDLRGVLLELTKEYNEGKPLPEDGLFDILIERTHQDLRIFIDNYIRGNEELLINHYLHYAGVRYFLFEKMNQSIPLVSPEYGIRKIDQNPWKVLINGEVTVRETTQDSPFRVGDEISFFEFQDQVKDNLGFDKLREGDIVKLKATNNGEIREVSFPLKFREMTKSDHYRIDEEVEDEKLNIRQKWWSY